MFVETSHLAGVHSLTTPECNNLATQTLATRSTLPVLRRLNEFHTTCKTADGSDQTTSNIVAGAVGGTLSGLLVAVLVAAVVIIIVVLGYRSLRKG